MLDFDRENGLPPADSEALDALWLLRWLPNTGNTALARFLDIHGEGLVLGTACASALQAIGEGFRRVRYGLSETVLCSGGGFPPFPRRDARVCQSPRAQPEPRAIGSVPTL